MLKIRYYCLKIGLLLSLPFCAWTQTDSLWNAALPEVDFQLLESFEGSKAQRSLDSSLLAAYQGQDLDVLLAQEGQLYIKDYGPSNISTSSMRGGSASHTALLWEGFNLESPMLGQVDFSLLPNQFFGQVDVLQGGQSALWGNGAMGGALRLHTPKLHRGLQGRAYAQIGSFDLQQQGLGLQWGKPSYKGQLQAFRRQAQNDFPYQPNSHSPATERLDNAATQAWGLQQQNEWSFQKRWKLRYSTWAQAHQRQIPPSLLESSSDAQQEDAAWRQSLQLSGYLNPNWQLQVRSGLFWEQLDFESSSVQSASQHLTWQSEAAAHWELQERQRKQQLHLGLLQQQFWAQSTGYQQPATQSRWNLLLHYQQQADNWAASVQLRQSLTDGAWQLPVASIEGQWQISPEWELRGQLGHHFRLPSLNDRFWAVGGNPDLKAEYGWTQDLGLRRKKGNFLADLSLYHHYISNWIQWTPNAQGLWTPENLQAVRSYGGELRLEQTWQWGQQQIRLWGQYQLRQSRLAEHPDSRFIGNQVLYVPQQQSQSGLHWQYRHFSLRYSQQLTGFVFLNNSNSAFLPAFTTGQVQLQQQVHWKAQQFLLFFQLRNIWDVRYQVVSSRPMPGRHFRLGLSWQFSSTQKKHSSKKVAD